MARPTRFKLKKQGKWVDLEDWQDSKRQPPPAPVMTQVDLASLPNKADLDPDLPFDHLMYENPSVRPYIYIKTIYEQGRPVRKELRVRNGIPPEYRAVACDIIRKYQEDNA